MAPEQALGDETDARSDQFAVGLILFEMVTGRKPFAGQSMLKTLHSIAHDATPAIEEPPAAVALDPIVRRALAKKPADRYPSAAAMAADLTAVVSGTARPRSNAVTRLIVLPFRILRSDPDTDFLAFSVPDAITTTLSGLKSLAVRSSLTAARFKETADLKQRVIRLRDNVKYGDPLYFAKTYGRGRVTLVTTTAGEQWTDWASSQPKLTPC